MKKVMLSSILMIDAWVLYLIMGVLIVLNIGLILYIILHSSKEPVIRKAAEAKRQVKNDTNVSVVENPATNQKIYTDSKEYRVVANEKQGGWYVKKRGEKTPVAYAKTKKEAEEIIESLK